MKAITLPPGAVVDILTGMQKSIVQRRAVPRGLIGRKMVLHQARTKTTPAMGCGYVMFGEATGLRNGDCIWPITSVERWKKSIMAAGRAGLWNWSYAHG